MGTRWAFAPGRRAHPANQRAGGDHLVLTAGVYRRTADFVRDYLPRWGIAATFVPIDDPAALVAALRPTTRLILAETPTNPYLRVLDLERTAALARRHGLLTAVDSTFATPINLRPLEHGFDLVLHRVRPSTWGGITTSWPAPSSGPARSWRASRRRGVCSGG